MAGLNRQFVLGEAFDCGPYWNEGPHEVEPAGGAECRPNFNKATDQWLYLTIRPQLHSGVDMRKLGSGLPVFCKAHRELGGLYENHNIGVRNR